MKPKDTVEGVEGVEAVEGEEKNGVSRPACVVVASSLNL